MKVAAVLAAKGSKVFTIRAEATVSEAVSELASNNIGALIVTSGIGAPSGIISERDIIRRLSADPSALGARVSELMTFPVICGTADDDVDSVLRMMTLKRFRHMPVLDGDDLVGMVTIGDLVKAQVIEYRGVADTLETRLMES
jgi:CBS domain-containing protein